MQQIDHRGAHAVHSNHMPALRVLYVEDHPQVRELIALLLEEEGLAVVACASPDAALAAFADGVFDGLITGAIRWAKA